jgi:hypothetical protein
MYSEWEHRFSSTYNNGIVTYSNQLYFARNNGITEYNLDSKESNQLTMLNSDLPGNRINSFLKLSENKILVSTPKGLALILNGMITLNDPICQNYPDTDSRKLYLDSQGKIWTYSAHKVYCYDNGDWKTINLEDSVTYQFDIWDLFLNHDNVWALFNDNQKTSTQFYENVAIDLQIRIAIVKDYQISNIFDTKNEFPKRQGSYSVVDAGDFIIWKNYDSVYTFKDDVWTNTSDFNYNGIIPFWYQDLLKDRNGNIWYVVSDSKTNVAYPVMYNIQTGEKTSYLQNEEEKLIQNVYVFENGEIAAKSANNIYFKKDTGWVKINKADFGLDDKAQFGNPKSINGKLYFNKYYGGTLPDGTMICIEDGSMILPVYKGLPYSNLITVEINKFGKGVFQGVSSSNDPLQYQADSSFVKLRPILVTNQPLIKTAGDGNVYFTSVRVDNTLKSNFLTTWEGNDLVKIDMGFADKNDPQLRYVDFSGDYLFGLGDYEYATDSLNTYLSIYNTKDKSLLKYDKNNSDMPDFYIERSGLMAFYMDTVPNSIAVDKYLNPWILTNESLFRFSPSGSEMIDISFKGDKTPLAHLDYDNNSNELIIRTYGLTLIYYYDIDKRKIDSFEVTQSGIKGNILMIKKLIDNNIWASDDLGYLYRYKGKGKFEVFDLKIRNQEYLGFPINDFSIDYNKNLHLATEIGLLTNNSLLSDVKENQELISDGFSVYPNPARDYIEIDFERFATPGRCGTSEDIRIFNTLGENVLPVEQTPSSVQSIDISKLSPGMYFIKIGNRVDKFVKM